MKKGEKMIAVKTSEIKEGFVKKVIFYNADNGFTVLILTDDTKVVGYFKDIDIENIIGIRFKFEGRWEDSKYGLTFKSNQAYMITDPIYYFLVNIVKGVGSTHAVSIIEHFKGQDITEIINRNPEALLQVKGIGKKRLGVILASWHEYGYLIELMKFLGQYNVSFGLVIKIYDNFKGNAIDIIKRNPYLLTQIKGIGFKMADKIALAMGIEEYSKLRIAAFILYLIQTISDFSGNTYVSKDTLRYYIKKELGFTIEDETIYKCIEFLNEDFYYMAGMPSDDKVVIIDSDTFCSKRELFFETAIYNMIKGRADRDGILSQNQAVQALKEYEQGNHISFDEKQREALITALTSGTSIITGYAGTGKTFIVKALINILSKYYGRSSFVGCAMSGIATRRLQDSTGLPSFTIHSLLGYSNGGFTYNKVNKLPYKVVILDEASMVNNYLFYSLTQAIDDKTVFIIIGDDAQLPPVGSGDIFHILLKHNIVRNVKLTKIFRQSDDSVINFYANDIRNCRIPRGYSSTMADWEFVALDTINYVKNEYGIDKFSKDFSTKANKFILEHVLRKARECMKDIENPITDFQVLTPMKMTELGVEKLNISLQKVFNNPDLIKDSDKVYIKNKYFCVGDKVVHLENKDMPLTSGNYTRIFNGNLGIIKQVDHFEKTVVVSLNIGYDVVYQFKDLGDIMDLAYCLTVHKAQGSEFKTIIVPFTSSHKIMLNNQWLYTAVTRGKEKVILIGEESTFCYACKKQERKKRNVIIDYLIQHHPEMI
jgi:exodeoxyribonuclease V alpha subunit